MAPAPVPQGSVHVAPPEITEAFSWLWMLEAELDTPGSVRIPAGKDRQEFLQHADAIDTLIRRAALVIAPNADRYGFNSHAVLRALVRLSREPDHKESRYELRAALTTGEAWAAHYETEERADPWGRSFLMVDGRVVEAPAMGDDADAGFTRPLPLKEIANAICRTPKTLKAWIDSGRVRGRRITRQAWIVSLSDCGLTGATRAAEKIQELLESVKTQEISPGTQEKSGNLRKSKISDGSFRGR